MERIKYFHATALLLMAQVSFTIVPTCQAGQHASLDQPLIAAIHRNDTDAVRRLLAQGANPNALVIPEDLNWPTALFVAARDLKGTTPADAAIIKMLLERGANPNGTDSGNQTPLLSMKNALKPGMINRTALTAMFAHGANPNGPDQAGLRLMMEAMEMRDVDLVKFFVHKGVNVNDVWAQRPPLTTATACNNVLLMQAVLDGGAKVNLPASAPAETRAPLAEAVEDNNVVVARFLLARGADPKRLPGLLHKAVEHDNPALVRTLMQHGATPDPGDDLMKMVNKSNHALLDALQTRSGKGPKDGLTLDEIALLNRGDEENALVMEAVLNDGADPNQVYRDGTTPLMFAALRFPKMTAVLLRHGANPRAKDRHGKTPRDYARDSQNARCLALLK